MRERKRGALIWRTVSIVGLAGWAVIVGTIGTALWTQHAVPARPTTTRVVIEDVPSSITEGVAQDAMRMCGETATLLAIELKPDSTLLDDLGMEIARDEDGAMLRPAGETSSAEFRRRLDAAIAARR